MNALMHPKACLPFTSQCDESTEWSSFINIDCCHLVLESILRYCTTLYLVWIQGNSLYPVGGYSGSNKPPVTAELLRGLSINNFEILIKLICKLL